MSTPISHHPPSRLGSRRWTWFLVAGLALAGLILALSLTRSGAKSGNPVGAAPAAVAPAPRARLQATGTFDAAHGTQADVPPYVASGTQVYIQPYIAPAKHGHNHPGGR